MSGAAEMNARALMRAQIDHLTAKVEALRRPVPPAERDILARAQARADGVAGLFGERALAPMPGEGGLAYRKRVLAGFQKHSKRFAAADLARMDAATLAPIEDMILADATTAAHDPARAAPGRLIPITTREGGRDVTRFTGDIGAFMAPFMAGPAVARIVRPA